MLITTSSLSALFAGVKAAFNQGFAGAPTAYKDVAMVVPSATREETYAWLGQFPRMREWVGDRVINNLAAQGYAVKNRDFEQTIAIPRNDIEDDTYGVFSPMFIEMGRAAAELPDELVFSLVHSGFTSKCYDGQYFFDTGHPIGNGEAAGISVSNMQDGALDPWFLLDTSRPIKPFIYQERRALNQLVAKDRPEDDNVFRRKEFVYGTDGRCNVGFGLWQLAYGSKASLNAANYEAARTAMQTLKDDNGRPLGIRPDTLVISPNNESAAMELLNSEFLANGQSNKWKGTAKVVMTPWLL
jgi:phage major head subunit gpT-like protein